MIVESVPDRPHALLSDADLDSAISINRQQQAMAIAAGKSGATKRVLAQLKRSMAELIDERNARADMQEIPW